jgi:hypothetical protein
MSSKIMVVQLPLFFVIDCNVFVYWELLFDHLVIVVAFFTLLFYVSSHFYLSVFVYEMLATTFFVVDAPLGMKSIGKIRTLATKALSLFLFTNEKSNLTKQQYTKLHGGLFSSYLWQN